MLLNPLISSVATLFRQWHQAKTAIEQFGLLSNDALHVLAGVLLQLLLALALRTSLASVRPWLVLFGLLLLNEAVDLWVEQWPELARQYGESARDVLLTMLVPTVLLFAVRRVPRLFHRKRISRRRR